MNKQEFIHDTALTIDITDAEGNPITTADHGDTIYITGELRDITDNVLLKNGTVELLVNGNPTGLTDITNADGIYSIPYTIYETTKFKTNFTEWDIPTMDQFRNDCIYDGNLTCTKDVLYNYLVKKTIAYYWWDFTLQERRAISEKVIHWWSAEYFGNFRKHGDGFPDCAGVPTDIIWKNAVCVANAFGRWCLLSDGRNNEGIDIEISNCYFKIRDGSVLCSYYPDGQRFYLPVYPTSACDDHMICALQLDPDIHKLDSWVFFQYFENNIRPGSSQMPKGSDVSILKYKKVWCGGSCSIETLVTFENV